jgi:hypothetical protein
MAANEPSIGLYRIYEHIGKAVPAFANKKVHLLFLRLYFALAIVDRFTRTLSSCAWLVQRPRTFAGGS